MDELANIKDKDTHGLKIDFKEGYEDSNQLFYSITKNVCEKGIEKSNIKNFNDQRDRVLTWKNLKDYCDQDGDKVSFILRHWRKKLASRKCTTHMVVLINI